MPHLGDFAPVQTQQAYRPVAYINSWVDFGGGYSSGAYFKDANGFVHLRGLMKSGTGIPTIAFNLPVGYRPAAALLFGVVSNNLIGRIDIQANGDVIAQVGSTVWMQLDGITFKAEG